MKVRDLIEGYEGSDDERQDFLSQRTTPALKDYIKKNASDGHNYVGSGGQAYVTQKDSQHELDRIRRISDSKRDLTVAYMAVINANPEIQKNPYFPRVLKASHDADAKVADFEIEKLYPLNSPKIASNEQLIKSLWERWFKPDAVAYVREHWASLVAHTIENAIRTDSALEKIADEQLAEAIMIIRRMMAQMNIRPNSLDIHSANLMWRMTGTMPQLVITDPWYK